LTKNSSLIAASVSDFRSAWKKLVSVAIAYEIIAFILLTPLVGLQFRIGLAVSGKAVLTDQDILFFFLGPVGWVCLITVSTLWLGIAAFRQSALMAIQADTGHQHIGLLGALQFARTNAWPVVRLTARIATKTLLVVAPFLVVAAAVYFTLLAEFDINYYLKERPPVFFLAIGIGGVIIVTLAVVLLRLFSSWFLALPLLLFENVEPADALAASQKRTIGHRRTIVFWISAWTLATMVLSTLASTIVVGLGRFIVPRAIGSLELLLLAIGVTLLFWAAVMFTVKLLSTTMLSVIVFNVYRRLGGTNVETAKLAVTANAEHHTGFQFSLKTCISVGVLGFIAAAAIGVFAIQSVRVEDEVEITAHRGSSKAAPENTIAAVRRAIEDGADRVEIDVQETADGTVVVFHDSDFMKLSGVNLKIWDATMDDLQEIDIGSWFAPEFQNERVPTLAEVLDVCKGRIDLNIELKYYGHDDQLEQRVADVVEDHDMAADVIVMSLKADAVTKMKQLRPAWKVGMLMSVYAGNLKKLDADFVAVNAGFAGRSFIRAAHGSGKEVHVWTVNDSATMSTLIGRGVDGLITDKPALARSVLDWRSQMSVPERLIMELAGIFGVVPEIGEQ
jgi:glycerophosphoryl diester phosphodiesterase